MPLLVLAIEESQKKQYFQMVMPECGFRFILKDGLILDQIIDRLS